MKRYLRVLRWVGVGSLVGVATITAAYLLEMDRAYDRIEGRSTVFPSPYGDIEYVEGGAPVADATEGADATPVLVIHGSGGGFDQGELLARAALDDRFHWIAPSRFGYLGSTFREGSTFDDQAHAYASLLDHLGIERVAVVALSHGGPSALLFAALHPERVSSLTLISCGVASSADANQADANKKGSMLNTIFQHDSLYWGITKVFRGRLTELMGANDTVVAGLDEEQREWVDSFIDHMNPVAPRSAGTAFDNTAAMPNERVALVQAPTLILHAEDDMLQLFHNAEFAAASIPASTLVSFEEGGHLLLAVEQERVRELTQRHIIEHAVRSAG